MKNLNKNYDIYVFFQITFEEIKKTHYEKD